MLPIYQLNYRSGELPWIHVRAPPKRWVHSGKIQSIIGWISFPAYPNVCITSDYQDDMVYRLVRIPISIQESELFNCSSDLIGPSRQPECTLMLLLIL